MFNRPNLQKTNTIAKKIVIIIGSKIKGGIISNIEKSKNLGIGCILWKNVSRGL
jgi:hypothetical protein